MIDRKKWLSRSRAESNLGAILEHTQRIVKEGVHVDRLVETIIEQIKLLDSSDKEKIKEVS